MQTDFVDFAGNFLVETNRKAVGSVYTQDFDLEGRPCLHSVRGVFVSEEWEDARVDFLAKVGSLPFRIILIDPLHAGILTAEWDRKVYSMKGNFHAALSGLIFEQVVQLRGIQAAIRRVHPLTGTIQGHPFLNRSYIEREGVFHAVTMLTEGRTGHVTSAQDQSLERWREVMERIDDMVKSTTSLREYEHPAMHRLVSEMVSDGRSIGDILQTISQVVRVNLEGFIALEKAVPLENVQGEGGPAFTDEEFRGGQATVSSMFTHEFEVSSRVRYSTGSSFVLPRLKKFNPAFYFWCVFLMSSFSLACQLGGTPIHGVPLCGAADRGFVYQMEVYHVNGSRCMPDTGSIHFEVLSPLDAAQYNCEGMTERYRMYLEVWNSTWVCGGNSSVSPQVASAPTTVSSGPYAGWSTAFQASTGVDNSLPRVCPQKFQALVGVPEENWPFLGGTSYRHCGGFSRNVNSRSNVTGGRSVYANGGALFGMKNWYTNPSGLGYPVYFVEDQDFGPEYTWKTPGCFDGWSTEPACQVGSGTHCYQVNGPSSWEIDHVNYNPEPRWCPQIPVAVDPVVCYSGPAGQIDGECLSAFQSGMQVNGSEAFCLNNICSVSSPCWCAYTVGREIAFCSGIEASRTIVTLMRVQNLVVSTHISRSASQASPIYMSWNQPTLKVSFVSSGLRTLIIQKSGVTLTQFCHGVSCEYTMEPSFYAESGYCYVSSMVEGSLESASQTWIEAAKWCKQYLSIWRVYPDWECLSSAQKAFAVMILILLAAVIIIAIPPVLTAVIATMRAVWATACFLTRSARSSPASVVIQNHIRGAYRSILPTIMLATVAMACQSGPSIGVSSPVCTVSGGVSTCTVGFSGAIQYSLAGQSFCWQSGTSDVGFELKYIYSRRVATNSFMYHSSDWKMVQETKFRCNQASCDAKTCKEADEKKAPNPNGQLSNTEVITHSGPSGCFTVDESVQASIEHFCSGLNPNCLYWKSSLVPHGEDLSCYRISSMRSIPVFNLTITTDSSETVQTFELDSDKTVGGVTIQAAIPTFDSRILPSGSCLVRGVARDYLTTCSKTNFPVAGQIGDIQSNFNLKNDSSSPIVFDPYIVKDVEVHSKDVTVSYIRSVVPDLLSSQPLPLTIGDSAWWVSNGTLQGLFTGQVSLTLFVSSDNFTYSRYVEEPCPVIESVTCDGCYSCEAGATVRVAARSSCISGVARVVLSTEPSVSSTMRLSALTDTKEVQFSTNIQHQDLELCIGQDCESVVCNLSEVTRLNETKEVFVTDSSSGDPGESPSRWLEDIFNGKGSWWQWILMVVIVIGLVVIVVMVTPSLIRALLSHLKKEKVVRTIVETQPMPDRTQMDVYRGLTYRPIRRAPV